MKTHTLYSNGTWQIDGFRNENSGNLALRVFGYRNAHGFCDYPIFHRNISQPRIAYDAPERIPQYVKKEVERLYGLRKGRKSDAVLVDLNGIL